MAKLRNVFVEGKMRKDTAKELLPQTSFVHAENLRFHINDGADGKGKSPKGSLKISDVTEGNTDLKCIGAYHNQDLNVIYYKLASTDGLISIDAEYDILNDETTIVQKDTNGVLKYDKTGFITGWDEIDGLQIWSEWGNNPRRINTERSKANFLAVGANGFTEEDIQLIVIPPFNKPNITLQITTTTQENFIEEIFPYFSYRWKYLDGEYSVLSPFSNPAFLPKDFLYDYQEQNSVSMVNRFNQIVIGFDTGNERVVEIQLIFKESESNSEWIIDDFNKEQLGWGHNEPRTFTFDNSKRYRALSDEVLRGSQDNVPRTNKAQAMINGRLNLGHYKERYNIENPIGTKLLIDYSVVLDTFPNRDRQNDTPIGIATLELETATHATTPSSPILTMVSDRFLSFSFFAGDPITIQAGTENEGEYTVVSSEENILVLTKDNLPNPTFSGIDTDGTILALEYNIIPTLIPRETAKSNRGYEIGIMYFDDPLRATTILVSETNTVFIDAGKSVNVNSFDVILKNLPPYFAKYYRFFIKQNKRNYDQISPIIFHEDDAYVWVKLEKGDIDKVKEGDYLIVKADTVGIKGTLVRTKVLEVVSQPQNFLEPEDSTSDVIQKAGVYFKLRPKNYTLDTSQQSAFNLSTVDSSGINEAVNSIINNGTYVGESHFYGDTLDDMTTSGAFTATPFLGRRYRVEIDGTNIPNTFRWSDDDGNTFTTEVDIDAGNPQLLNDGVSVTFASDAGHSALDNWTFYTRADIPVAGGGRIYGFFRFFASHGEDLISLENDKVKNGAQISIEYQSTEPNDSYLIEVIAQNNYDNIQEWFFEDNIKDLIEDATQNPTDIWFARGTIAKVGSETKLTIDNDFAVGAMTMVARTSVTSQQSIGTAYADTEIIQSSSAVGILLETEGKNLPPETYYEIGKTYKIVNGFHISDNPNIPSDRDQTGSIDLKVRLDWFNAFCYGNAVESYKIKDEFNRKGIDLGIRTSAVSDEEYKEVDRIADVTWSGVYQDNANFNGLSTFNLSTRNWVVLDKESASIQKLLNFNSDLLVFQENAIGIMPYNKNIIKDIAGGSAIGIAKDILNKESYRPYAGGLHGVSKHPESVVARGRSVYLQDKNRGDTLRLANNGITEINRNELEHEMSNLMEDPLNNSFVSAFDPKHKEYLSTFQTIGVLAFKEKAKGFPNYYTFQPDFMLGADNALYGWKNGVMYKMNATENHNNFFGVQYLSKLKFYVNHEFGLDKIFKAMSLFSSHAWDVIVTTTLTSRSIPKEHFEKHGSFWFADIMTNTNNNTIANNIFGIGEKPIVNGEIEITEKPSVISIGDHIVSSTLLFTPSKIIDITETKIIIEDPLNTATSFLMYSKNQAIDGVDITGDCLEVELSIETEDEVIISSVTTEVEKY